MSAAFGEIILHKEIPIPKVNEYPFDKAEEWAKRSYASALSQVDERRAEFLKEDFQIRTADYVEKKTFGEWRLTGPAKGRPDKEAPLNVVLECLKPYIPPAPTWGKFRRVFTKQLKKPSFTAIHNSYYDPTMVKEVNERINQTLKEFARPVRGDAFKRNKTEQNRYGITTDASNGAREGFIIHLEFVLHPETAESYNSPRCLEMRRRIWEHYGIKFDLSQYEIADKPIPGRLCQMAMHLDIQVSRYSSG